MMHSTYSSYSSIVSIKTTNFVFNDCNYPNERCPSSYNCSCCCSFPVNYTRLMMPMNLNPSLLYGLRQSTLIQWPPYRRRVVLGSSDRYCYRPSIYEAGRCCCCVESCGVRKERVVGRGCVEKCCVEKRRNLGGDGVLGRRGNKGNFVEERRSNAGDKIRGRVIRCGRDFRCNALGDAEAMLSLLCEEGVKECVPVRGRKKSLSKEAKVVREENVVSETGKDGKGDVLSGSRHSESESKRQLAESSMARFREESLKRRDERESLSRHLSGSRYLDSESKRQSAESRRAHFREEGVMVRDERESLSVHEDERLRRRESCSSYYSLSDSDEYQSDSDVDVKEEIIVGDSSTSQGKDFRKTGGVVISEVTKDDSKSYRDEEDERLISSRHENVRKWSSAEWDWRKKSEKKLTDDSTGVNKFRRESVAQHSNLSQVNNSSSLMASSSKKQFSNLKNESTSDVSSSRQSRYSTRKDDHTSEYVTSRARYEHSTTDGRYPEYSESQVAVGNQVSEQLASHGRHEMSTSAASSSGQLKAQITIDNQKNDYLKSSWRHEQSSQTNRQNVQSTSTTVGRLIQGEGATVVDQSVQETGCDYCISCGRSKETAKLEVDIQQGAHSAEFSEIHGDARWNTATRTAQSQSESRHTKQQTGTSSFQRFAEESKQRDEWHRAGQFDARMDSGYRYDQSIRHSETMGSDYRYDQSMKHSETVDSDNRYDQRVRSEKKEELAIKHLDASISLKSPQAVKNLQEGSVDRVTKENESRKLSQTGATASQVPSASMVTSLRSASENRMNVEHTISTTKLKSVEESVEKHELVDKTFMQTKLRTEVQGPVLQVGSIAEFSEGNTSEPTVGSTSETRVPQVSQAEIKSDLHLIVTSPSYHSVERNSTDSEPESSLVRKSTGSTAKVDSGSGYSLSEGTKTSSSDEANERFVSECSPEDTFSSAERMQESSTQIVDEFVEKMRHESSAFQTKIEKKLLHADKKQKQKESTQPQTEKAMFSKQDLSHVSGSSVTEGLLDDVWRVKDHSVEEAPDSGSSKEEMSRSVATRRTGKSLWNVVSGVFRLRWGLSSEPPKSPAKPSQRSSSSDSASGETWFSGNENDEGTGDSMKRQRLNMSQEPISSNQSLSITASTRSRQEDRKKKQPIGTPQAPASDQSPLGRTAAKSHKKDRRKKEQRSLSQEPTLDQSSPRRSASRSQKEESTLVSLDDRLSVVEVNVTPSLNVAQGGSIAGGVDISESTGIMIPQTSMPNPLRSSVPSARQLRRSDALEEIEVVGKIEEPMSSTSEQSDSSRQDLMVPSAGRLKRSDVFDEIVEVGRTEELISSTSELQGHSVDVMESGVPTSEETDAELKRRKLQRSKQVLSDRFDEWEDAYRRENEQRKVDEIFMREALAEAIRAADSWEVPVGAVLVQNGKIIARGYNLVEELRDSTAHAEMICIREASNVLRTWRLSETTLYVTLEPCPMCAGAILQARIKTLVWGAPNKLLGADGSWIRLFPEGVEGDQRTEVADKPAAPQHPFHPKMNIRRGILESECAQIMQQFFQLRRRKETEKKKKAEEESQASCLPVPHNPAKLLRKMHGVFHHT